MADGGAKPDRSRNAADTYPVEIWGNICWTARVSRLFTVTTKLTGNIINSKLTTNDIA